MVATFEAQEVHAKPWPPSSSSRKPPAGKRSSPAWSASWLSRECAGNAELRLQ